MLESNSGDEGIYVGDVYAGIQKGIRLSFLSGAAATIGAELLLNHAIFGAAFLFLSLFSFNYAMVLGADFLFKEE